MFQTLVEDPIIFYMREPKRSRDGDGGQKRRKKRRDTGQETSEKNKKRIE